MNYLAKAVSSPQEAEVQGSEVIIAIGVDGGSLTINCPSPQDARNFRNAINLIRRLSPAITVKEIPGGFED